MKVIRMKRFLFVAGILFILLSFSVMATYTPTYSKQDKNEMMFDYFIAFLKGYFEYWIITIPLTIATIWYLRMRWAEARGGSTHIYNR